MPIYEFHCQQCRQDSEVLVRSSDWTGTTCPHCGSTKLAKKLSIFASTTGTPETACGTTDCSMNMGGQCGCSCQGMHHH